MTWDRLPFVVIKRAPAGEILASQELLYAWAVDVNVVAIAAADFKNAIFCPKIRRSIQVFIDTAPECFHCIRHGFAFAKACFLVGARIIRVVHAVANPPGIAPSCRPPDIDRIQRHLPAASALTLDADWILLAHFINSRIALPMM